MNDILYLIHNYYFTYSINIDIIIFYVVTLLTIIFLFLEKKSCIFALSNKN